MQTQTAKPRRPTGVTVLSVLAILVGIGGLLAGAGSLIIYAAISSGALSTANYTLPQNFSLDTLQTYSLAFGAFLLVSGVLYLVTGIGFLGGRGWSWTLGLVISAISIIAQIVLVAVNPIANIGGAAFSIIVGVVIIYYLMRPHVKAFFGKGPVTTTTSPPTGQM